MVEYELPKLGVAGSNPVARSNRPRRSRRAGLFGRNGMGIFGKTDSKPGQGGARPSTPGIAAAGRGDRPRHGPPPPRA